MGLFISKLYELYESFGKTQARVLMLGLDNAGKTTVLYKLKLNETVATIPTIGFNVETIEPVKGVSFTVWDIGGQDKIRPLWRQYFQNSEALVYVVDSCDRERIGEAQDELKQIVMDDSMRGVPIVIMANKQDLPTAMTPSEIIDRLGLRSLPNKWHVQGTCAKSGEGVYDAIHMLSGMVKEFKKKNEL